MTHRRLGLACALALLFALGCALPAAASAADIIVQRDPGLSPAERADLRADAGVELERMLPLPHAELVTVPAGRERHALAALNADPDVRYAVPDVRVHAAAGTVSPFQWGLTNTADTDIDAPEAWDISEGAGITVAVVDAEVDTQHPNLDGRIAPGAKDFVPAGGCSAAKPEGIEDHGTHVAGIVAANGVSGVYGVAPAAQVLPLRALDNCGGGDLSWILSAFEYAGDDPDVDVVSASFGTDPWLPAGVGEGIELAFDELLARHSETLFVVAAGNEGNDNDALPVYPCSSDAPNLMCVGMSDTEDSPVCWGNVGQTSVDIFAPGDRIFSTVRGAGRYALQSGTSMATPMVAGAAALVLSYDPSLDAREVLESKADPKLGMEGTVLKPRGRLSVAAALGIRGTALGSGGGPGRPWVSCDPDHDGFRGANDHCLDAPGTIDGCPDADDDGLRDLDDNCDTVVNPGQADADGDGLGDLCDSTPRGDDVDGDAKAALDDRCPTQPAPTPDGCPEPVVNPPGSGGGPLPTPVPTATPTPGGFPPAPKILLLDVAVLPRRCVPGRKCTKSAKVTVKLSRTAKVAVKVEQRVRGKWRRVTTRSITATMSGRSLTVRGTGGRSLTKGSYRVTATLAGVVKTARKSFRV